MPYKNKILLECNEMHLDCMINKTLNQPSNTIFKTFLEN